MTLLGPYLLQLLRTVQELVGVCLGHNLPFIGLRHEVLVALFLGKVDGVLFAFEVEMRSLEVICRRLPAHQWVLPPMAALENIPVHPPLMPVPVA